MTLQILSTSSSATETLGERLGHNLKGGEVIELISDLGGGKTTLVRGLARGMKSHDHVSSPTFTISKIYHSPTLTLHHFDFYRLPKAGVVSRELREIVDDPDNVVVIEWAEVVKDVLPLSRLVIDIRATSEAERQLVFTYNNSLAYLMKGVE